MNDTSSTEADLWHVEVSSGEVLVVTLEQLDDAFNDGLVNESTRVWQSGMASAVSLGELLGLDPGDDANDQPAPLRSAIPPAPALVPTVYPQAPAPSMYPQARSSVPPRSAARPPAQTSAWPPVVAAPTYSHSHSAPPPASSPTAWQISAVPSVIPTAFDIGDDLPAFAKPKRRGVALLAFAALAAMAAGAAVFFNGAGEASAAVAVPPPPVVEAPRSHAYDPGNEPIHLRDVPPPVEITKPDAVAGTSAASATPAKPTAAEAASLREAALRAANSKVSHARAKVASTRSAHVASKTKATGFKGTKSGSKYDPLNGAL